MKIAIDIDGTIYETEKECRVEAEIYDIEELHGKGMIDKSQVWTQNRYSWSEEENARFISKFVDITKKANLLPGAKEVIKKFENMGIELIVISARGNQEYEDNEKMIESAKKKLKDDGFKFSKIIFKTPNKLQTCIKENVDFIIDDTPESVVISGFDPLRREVAKIALENLIEDGRIHPAKIEEMVEKAKTQVAKDIKEEGERAAMETGVMGLNPEIINLLGKLKFRTSYGQNVLMHSIEVSNLARMMADELGLDTKLAARAGLLHDLGKALDHDMEGTHVQIGVDILKKYNENSKVINAVEAHHGDVEAGTPEAYLVQAADAISASRPGARRETLEAYTKRLEQLEEIANNFEGVEKSYAIQAGREIRIIVKPEKISDDQMTILARDIAKKIEEEMEYPGQIKVNLIREKRVTDYAK